MGWAASSTAMLSPVQLASRSRGIHVQSGVVWFCTVPAVLQCRECKTGSASAAGITVIRMNYGIETRPWVSWDVSYSTFLPHHPPQYSCNTGTHSNILLHPAVRSSGKPPRTSTAILRRTRWPTFAGSDPKTSTSCPNATSIPSPRHMSWPFTYNTTQGGQVCSRWPRTKMETS